MFLFLFFSFFLHAISFCNQFFFCDLLQSLKQVRLKMRIPISAFRFAYIFVLILNHFDCFQLFFSLRNEEFHWFMLLHTHKLNSHALQIMAINEEFSMRKKNKQFIEIYCAQLIPSAIVICSEQSINAKTPMQSSNQTDVKEVPFWNETPFQHIKLNAFGLSAVLCVCHFRLNSICESRVDLIIIERCIFEQHNYIKSLKCQQRSHQLHCQRQE